MKVRQATTHMNLQNILVNERRYKRSHTSNTHDTLIHRDRTQIGGYQGEGEQRYEKLNRYKVSFRGDENVLELDKLAVAQL